MYDFSDYLKADDPITFILKTICFYAFLFPITDCLFMIWSKQYRTYEHTRQYNIVSNILKSAVLAFIAYCSIVFAISLFTGNSTILDMRSYTLSLTAIYCTTDIVSLILNYHGLQFSTRTHHIVVAFVYIYSIYIADFEKHGIYVAMIMYGAFSSLAFLVNTYLGARFLLPSWATLHLKRLALISYIVACFMNWTSQICYCAYIMYIGNNYFSIIILIIMIYVWMVDDCKLINHLTNTKTKTKKNH